MAEYLIKDTTLTNMADKVRTLSGNTGTMTPTVMTSTLEEANNEVTSQIDILSQIKNTLSTKAFPVCEVLDDLVETQDDLIDDIINTLSTKAIQSSDALTMVANEQTELIDDIGYSLDGKAVERLNNTYTLTIDASSYNGFMCLGTKLVDGVLTPWHTVIEAGTHTFSCVENTWVSFVMYEIGVNLQCTDGDLTFSMVGDYTWFGVVNRNMTIRVTK